MAQNENIANRKKQETIKKTVKPSRASWPNHLIYTMQTNTKFCQLPTTAALKKSQWGIKNEPFLSPFANYH